MLTKPSGFVLADESCRCSQSHLDGEWSSNTISVYLRDGSAQCELLLALTMPCVSVS